MIERYWSSEWEPVTLAVNAANGNLRTLQWARNVDSFDHPMIDHSRDAVRIDVRDTLMPELHTCNTRNFGARAVQVEIVQRFAESAICDNTAVKRYNDNDHH